MRLLLAGLLLTCGCRQLLGLDDLPGDAGHDARVVLDADPSRLALTRVTPSRISEGIGSSSRPAVLVVEGMHIVPGATVEITVANGGRGFTVDSTKIQVSRDGTMLAFPMTVEPDATLAAGARLQLDVTVTQETGMGPVSKTLGEMLEIVGLDELTGSVALSPGVHEYSTVDASTLTAANPAGGPIMIRSMSTVTLGGITSVNGSGQTGGAGGGNGGAGGPAIGGAGQPGMGPGAGLPSGGGGSYGTRGGGNAPDPVGNPALPTLEMPNRGSGGAGGNANGTPNPGGAGGGGGGTIEITANGAVVLSTIQARGGNGTVAGADDGGGGSGGTILLRGASIQLQSIDVSGGLGLNAGGVGRIRIDAPGSIPAMDPPAYRGPTFDAETPLITTTAKPEISAHGQPLTTFSYFFTTAKGDQLRGPFQATFGSTGLATFTLDDSLFEGLDLVCLLVDGGEIERAESRNCVDIAYLF